MSTRRLAAVPDAQRRAGLYVRVSAVMGREGEDFLSPSIQADTMRAAALRAGHDVLFVWEDIDVSGRSMTRPGLTQAVDAARRGDIDALWCYDLSRFARNAAGGLAELAAIEKMGVEVLSATETLDRSTSAGRLTAGVLLLLAEHYSDMVGDRWRGVIAANAERGVWHGQVPLGYVRTGRREIGPDPVLGPALAQGFRDFAAGTTSIRRLSLELARLAGRPVLAGNLRRSLASEAYLGRVVVNGRTYPGRHAALVDQAMFEAVQARLALNAKTASRTLQATYSLAGLAKCAGCGWTLWRRTRHGRALQPFLACRGRAVDGSSRCEGVGTPPIVEVEAAVLEQIRRRLVDVPDASAAEAVRLAAQERARVDLSMTQDELVRTEKALGVLAQKLAEEVLSDMAYRAASAGLEEKAGLLRARLADAVAVVEAPTFVAARDLAVALLELWPSMTPEERRAALGTHVREVVVRRAAHRGEPVADRTTVVFR